jgi:PPM family protein phosphatase
MKLEVAMATDAGKVRRANEDAVRASEDARLVVVADGMGGHALGALASRLAVEAVEEYFRATADDLLVGSVAIARARLQAAVEYANRCVFEHPCPGSAEDRMGTTIVAAHFLERHAVVAHVGDSRCYRFRGGVIAPLTSDHSLVAELRRVEPSLASADLVRYQHVVTRAIGLAPLVETEVDVHGLEPHDLFMLCTDGLWGVVPEETLRAILGATHDLDDGCKRLVAAANEAGGPDNATVALVRTVPLQATRGLPPGLAERSEGHAHASSLEGRAGSPPRLSARRPPRPGSTGPVAPPRRT